MATIRQQLIQAQCDKTSDKPKAPAEAETPQPGGSQTSTEFIKKWERKEVELLFSLRSSMEEKFLGAKAHKLLWDEIAKEMLNNTELCTKATGKQCENKYKALKREYKKTFDHNNTSGNDRKECPFYDEFNSLYGMKAGTKPAFTLGTLEETQNIDEDVDESPSTSKPQPKKQKRKKKEETLQWLAGYEERQVAARKEYLDTQREMHKDKVSLFERLIQAVEKNNN